VACSQSTLPRAHIRECTGCKKQDLAVVQTPYAFKLLIQELEGMGLQVRLSHDPFAPDSDAEHEESDEEHELESDEEDHGTRSQ